MSLSHILILCLSALLSLAVPVASLAQSSYDMEVSEEETRTVEVSPKRGWGSSDFVEEDDALPFWAEALLWPVNRLLDFIDVFRADLGVGPAYGGVLRLTRYGQMGYREMAPGSFRVGLLGRRAPILIETSSESGFGPWFAESKQRSICEAEVALGFDLGIAGAQAGRCFDELFEFLGGIVFLDPSDAHIR